jgi:segregation and condensation protein B
VNDDNIQPESPTDAEAADVEDGVELATDQSEVVGLGTDEAPLETPEKWESDPDSRMRRIEAVLFMARKPLSSRKISDLAHLEDGTQARTMIGQLNSRYDSVGRSFHIKKVAAGFQMLTRPQFSDWIRRLEHVPRPLRLSTPAMETLTVVAYRQPIIKAEIEAIRGVSCGEMLRQLLEINLIKIAGRSEKLGRPFLYATSKDFLTCFGLNNLQERPRADKLVGEGLPEWASVDNNLDNNLDDSNNQTSPSVIEETIKETEL